MTPKVYDHFLKKIVIDDINNVEININYQLPEYYKKFLLKHNGGRLSPNNFKTINCEIESQVQFLFGVTKQLNYDLENNYNNWNNLIKLRGYLPIGIDVVGNLLLLDLDIKYGEVFLWVHDTQEVEILLVNVNFESFLKSLYKVDIEESELDLAISKQDISYFDYRILNGEHIDNIKNEFGQRIAVIASLKNKLNILKYAYKRGADMNGLLIKAASNGHYNIVNYLISLNVNVNERDGEQNNDTPLIQAAYGGYLDIVKKLIEIGADINAKDMYGQGVLTKAYWSNNDEMVLFLENLGLK